MTNRLQKLAQNFRMRVGLDRPSDIAAAVGLMSPTAAGANINANSALSLSTVYACTYRIASTIASLGLCLYEEQGRGRSKLFAHPSYRASAVSPNSEVTAFQFWETILADAILRGCGYAYIQRGAGGRVQSLQIIPSEEVERKQSKTNGEVFYQLKRGELIASDDMLEICNLYRMSPIQLHRENLGLARSAQDYGAQYFSNGGQMTGVLSSEQPLSAEKLQVVTDSWNASRGSAGTKLLPFGFKYQRVSIAPEEAQFIQTRKFQAEEICRIFSVPPALVQVESQTTYNNVEQQNLQFSRYTVMPWACRIEQELNRKLLTQSERETLYFKYELKDLYRGDMAARSAYFTQMTQAGIMSINECRAAEELNPVEGGDIHTVGVNNFALSELMNYSKSLTNNGAQRLPEEREE